MLLHGWGGSADDMMPAAYAFASTGYRAVVFDMPGHGKSAGRESSLVEFLRAMRAVAGALGAPDLIVGHSFGGAAAVFGITELGLPVRGAVLFSPAPGPAYYVDRFAAHGWTSSASVTDGMMRRIRRARGSIGRVAGRARGCADGRRSSGDLPRPSRSRSAVRVRRADVGDAWSGSRLVPRPSLGHKRILRDPGTIAAAVEFARRHSERQPLIAAQSRNRRHPDRGASLGTTAIPRYARNDSLRLTSHHSPLTATARCTSDAVPCPSSPRGAARLVASRREDRSTLAHHRRRVHRARRPRWRR